MQISLFLKNKIQRQLQLNGQDLIFIRYGIDEYKQVSDEVKESVVIRGLFHTTNSYIKNVDTEGARLVSKPQPMILALYEDGNKVQKDDEVEMQGHKYKVTALNDVNNFGIAIDISLELIDG